MRRFRLDLRRVFRRFGKKEQERWAAAIRSLGKHPKKKPDGKPVGGSLAREVKQSSTLKVKRWGYVIALHKLGQRLTWLVRGTKHQPARPLPKVETDVEGLSKALEAEAHAQFSAWDRSSRGGSRA